MARITTIDVWRAGVESPAIRDPVPTVLALSIFGESRTTLRRPYAGRFASFKLLAKQGSRYGVHYFFRLTRFEILL